jgi:RES domain-containing protein
MFLYRIAHSTHILDLSGYGAFLHAGRWHSEGTSILYCSSSPSLALLEVLVHLPANLPPKNLCMMQLDLPAKYVVAHPGTLPKNWTTYTAPVALRSVGDSFAKAGSTLGLSIPSAIISIDYNILLNPKHPAFSHVKIVDVLDLKLDRRLLK